MTALTLPAGIAVVTDEPRLLDRGLILRPATGAPAQHFDRPGSRFALDAVLPPMTATAARVPAARLLRAKRDGLRIPFSLLGASQGSPGAPLVRTATAGGTALPLKGLTVGYVAREGYWLTVIDAAGIHYLHTVAADATANGSGDADLTVYPPLRTSLAVNDVILLQAPMIEGLVTSDVSIPRPSSRIIQLSFSLEEQG